MLKANVKPTIQNMIEEVGYLGHMIGDLTSYRIGDVFQEEVAFKLRPRGFENISRL